MNNNLKRLRDICDIIGGIPAPQDESAFSIDGFPFIRMKDLGRYHLTSNLIHVDDRVNGEFLKKNKTKIVKKGAILLPRSGSVALNHRAILGIDAFIVSHICALQLNDPEIDNVYLYYALRNLKMNNITKKTTGLDAITFEDLGNIRIYFPSLSEQRNIVSILDKADIIRQKRKESIALLDEYLKSVFLEMFGSLKSNKFSTIDLEKLSVKITDGTHNSPKFLSEGVPFLLVSNIVNNEIQYETKKYISEEEYLLLNLRTPIEIGDILITSVGSYGNAAIVKTITKFAFQRHIAYIKPKHDKIEKTYLLGSLKSDFVQNQIKKLVKGVAQKTLNLAEFRKLKIPIPPLSLQTQFADIVEQVENTKTKMEGSLKEMDNQFNAFTQKYFNTPLEN